jgi:diguanylate cyclase (GGDEF)-like protein
MLYYVQLGATIFTPIPAGGRVAGALIVDQLSGPRTWDSSILEACKNLAEALGARMHQANLGAHLATEEGPSGRDTARINVLANVARLVDRAVDPEAAAGEIVDLLSALPWIESVKHVGPKEENSIVRDAIAHERIVARAGGVAGNKTQLGIPVFYEGEPFGGFEVLLTERLTEHDEQFWRTLRTFAGTAYANARRRGRPRDNALLDALTGLPNFRSINEQLIEAVHASRSSGRPVSAWLVDIEKLDVVNRSAGYAVGDDVVGYVGATLGAVAGTRGSAGRVGGGMFLVVFPGMEGDEAAVQAKMMVERVTKNVPGHLPAVAISTGVSAYPAQAAGPDDLLRSTRLALYAAKVRGNNAVVVARAKDEAWVRDARAAFIRIITEQQMPAALQGGIRK